MFYVSKWVEHLSSPIVGLLFKPSRLMKLKIEHGQAYSSSGFSFMILQLFQKVWCNLHKTSWASYCHHHPRCRMSCTLLRSAWALLQASHWTPQSARIPSSCFQLMDEPCLHIVKPPHSQVHVPICGLFQKVLSTKCSKTHVILAKVNFMALASWLCALP